MDLLQHIIGWFVAWRLHRQQRRELLDYLASDHRAAADIGITPYEAQQYVDRPFRRRDPSLRAQRSNPGTRNSESGLLRRVRSSQ
jgi:uncharacterized protein YjiS (DUF1127 family)